MVYALVVLTTILTVLCGTVSRSWSALMCSTVLADGWYAHTLASDGSTMIYASIVTSGGPSVCLMLSSTSILVATGIAVAMHGVSTYAHTYMGYEHTVHYRAWLVYSR